MKPRVEFITYASYHNIVANHVVPYFEEKDLLLKQITTTPIFEQHYSTRSKRI
ncbi:MAG: hypothetical protein ACQEXV_09720 [Bacillota bacterium]